MDSIKSIKVYGKVDNDQVFQRTTRNRVIYLVVAAVFLVFVIAGIIIGVKKSNSDSNGVSASLMTPSASVKTILASKALVAEEATIDLKEIFNLSLHMALNELVKVSSLPGTLISKISDERALLIVCQSVCEDVFDSLNDSTSLIAVNDGKKLLSPSRIEDAKTWLTSALTCYDNCHHSVQ